MLSFVFAILTLVACSTTDTGNLNPEPDPDPRPVDPEPVTQEWKAADIGGVNLGTSDIEDQQIILRSIGDIADGSDQFHFTYQEAAGDVGIVAHLVEHSATTPQIWPKAGLTIRGGLNADDANVTIYAIDNDQYRGLIVTSRNAEGEDTVWRGSRSGATAPLWLRVVRDGNEVVAQASPDGTSWEEVASATVQLPEEVYVGLAVAAGSQPNPVEAVYESVSIFEAEPGDPTDLEPTPEPNPEPNPDPEPNPEPEPEPTPEPTPVPNPDPNPGPKTETTYQIDTTSNFLNPERGFHSEVDLINGTGFDSVRNRGYTLVRSYVRLDDYRNSAIPSNFIDRLGNGLERARSAGIKVVLRFSYNFGNGPDAPLDRVLQHIDQLEPVLHEYADVIAVLQAGFIGAWGEWHSSQNNLTTSSNKRTIGQALLDATPDSRMVQVRAPFHRRDIVGSPDPNVDIFGDSHQARLGFKNDCFLSTDSDTGTYGGDQVRDRRETAEFTTYTATGGETCAIGYPSSRQDCVNALDELAQFHWDYLNSGFHSGVLNRWRDQGCFDEITRRLGYRLGLESGAVSADVAPGGTLTVDLSMRNDGFGKVYNPRPIDIVLRNTSTGETRTVRAVSDARTILPLAGESRDLQLSVTVPNNLPAGSYDVLLSLPDAASNLANDVRYNIRFANVGMWQESTGLNDLGLTTRVGN